MTTFEAVRTPTLTDRVSEFVFRCGRVLAVPIAHDSDLLGEAHAMSLRKRDDGSAEVWKLLPPEVQLDALAARARPLLLEDRCSYKTGLKALRRLGKATNHPRWVEYDEAIRDLREGWETAANAQGSRYFLSEQRLDSDLDPQSWSDTELAAAWKYGDLVHADEGKQHVSERRERMIAGWSTHAEICSLARTSVSFVQGFNEELELGIPATAFETEDLPSGWVHLGNASTVWSPSIADQASGTSSATWRRYLEMEDLPAGDNPLAELAPGQWLRVVAHPSAVHADDSLKPGSSNTART
ncbi:hypothetical protein EU513_15210 [Yimella sp. RIT 621]|uniref:hypothetical protein n=1 Tax=Yimella sp. RIT 621 TaxID=2510323 RepID=UPI00101DC09D|nr:hypothetical protein [Yimella sp. RIT 621]RYG75841.1 hypothetical protein EU513_15210 [Yimella sp. RIT 621]